MAAAMELALAIGAGHACGLDHHPLRDAWPAVEPPRLRVSSVEPVDAPGLGFAPGALEPPQ
jgi:hypothetical protein